MNQLWKIQVLEPRRTDNSAMVKATYRGGDSFFELKSVVTLTPEGRKQFAEICDQRLKAHLDSLSVVDKDLVKELEDEMNGKPFAIDELNKKKLVEERHEKNRKARIEKHLDEERAKLEGKSSDGDDAPVKDSYADESAADAPTESETPAPVDESAYDAKKATSSISKASGSAKSTKK